ncbi:MAG: ribosome small subunit-dependent GTPase A [Deltaproteobacteria bacterium]
MQEGQIIKGIGGFYYVKEGAEIYECKARGALKKGEFILAVGDNVEFIVNDEVKLIGVIEKVKPRKNFLIRPPVSNIDQLIIVFSVKSPAPDFMLLDKLIIKAAEIGIKPIICINKIDLSPDGFKEIECYENAGYETVLVSAVKGLGIEKLKEKMKDKISILAGPSGVGKSTIVNALNINALVKTGAISNKIERGKHTTRHVELFEIKDGGYIADTPGFTFLNIEEVSSEKLQSYYPEFDNHLEKCRFKGCSHVSEPDCGIKEALKDNEIDNQRYDRYVELYKTLKEVEKYKR